MAPLLEYLRGLGVVPRPVPVAALTARERLLDAFVGYLAAERGLAVSTLGNYRGVAVRFLATQGDWPAGIAGVDAEQVSAFVLAEAARRSAGSLKQRDDGAAGAAEMVVCGGIHADVAGRCGAVRSKLAG